jgi:hypothetical protein
MSDIYIQTARLVAWLFERRDKLPTVRELPDDRALASIMALVVNRKIHLAFTDDDITGVVIYDDLPDHLYLHLIVAEEPTTMYDLALAWVKYFPDKPIKGWRVKCKRALKYPQKTVLRILKITTENVPQSTLCLN